MGEKELRELFQQRLYMELMFFKDSVLQKEKGDIFKDSYKTGKIIFMRNLGIMHVMNWKRSRKKQIRM